MSPSTTPATQSAAAPQATNGAQARHQTQPSVKRGAPAKQNQGRWRQVLRLPCKAPRRPSAPPDPTQCHKRHACHAKRDKVVCERLYVKGCVCQGLCVTKLCQRLRVSKIVCVTKFCERLCVSEIVCDKVVCQRLCVTKLLCERLCVTKLLCESCCV